MFYPAEPEVLREMVNRFIGEASDFHLSDLKAIICPHAGYIYSGPTAGFAYRQMAGRDIPQTLFLVGPAHYGYVGASAGDYDSFLTPLGEIPVNRPIVKALEEAGLSFEEEAHRPEHSLEVQLPFLQAVAPDFSIVPILVGGMGAHKLGNILDPYFLRSDVFFVISSDLSHYLPYEEAVRTDQKSLRIIESLNLNEASSIDACGKTGIEMMMILADRHGYKIKLLDYRNSGDTAGDKSAVVGYGALAVYKG